MPSLDRAADSIILGSFVIRLISIPKDALPRRSISISDAVRWYCWVETCSSLRIRTMTVEAVPRTARMIITRISQEGMDANKPRTRTVANERLGAANAGNTCAEIRWVTRWSESQYLSSIVFKIHLHCLLCFVPWAIAIIKDSFEIGLLKSRRCRFCASHLHERLQEAKSCRAASRYSLGPSALSTDSHGRQPSPHGHA
jgi:hypothetical protein